MAIRRDRAESRALPRALALLAFAYAAHAGAQFTATISAVSDYRYRGVSLSGQNPALQANLGYDGAHGLYAGVFGSTVQLAGEAATTGQAIVYAGVATKVGDDWHWDVGANYSAFSEGRDYDYGEVYTGIASQRVRARLHYAPNYFGVARASLYGEIDGTHPLDERFLLIAHAGVLVPLGSGGTYGTKGARNPVDVRIGIGTDVAGFNLQLAWVGVDSVAYAYPVYGNPRRNTAVLSVARSF